MKIVLINPPFLFPVKNEIVHSHCLGLRYISSYLKAKGTHQVEFIDALIEGFENVREYANGYIAGLEIKDIVNRIPDDTELIGLSVPFSQLAPVAHALADEVKRRIPNAILTMGGIYPSTQPGLALTSSADLIIVGEGEEAFLQIAEGKTAREIRGVWAREWAPQDQLFLPTEGIEDLDLFPFPDYSIPGIERYFTLSPRMFRDRRTASMITSRGCPFHCEFCSIHPVYGRQWRFRSAGNVLEEITYLVKKMGVTALEFEDDNLTLQRKRTAEILEGMIRLNEEGHNLGWRTPNGVRIDTLDKEIRRLIKRSRCEQIVLALEHGDQEMLRIMDKRLDLDKAFEVIKGLVREGVPFIGLFVIVGYPGETRERYLKSLKYLKKIKALGGNILVCVNIAQPYPGTRLLKQCLEKGYIRNTHIDNFLMRKDMMGTGYHVSITTPDFDEAEVLRRRDEILHLFGQA
jgi:radical SAM superfamily enzyme YgiQ (UPF0313 family)